VPHHSAATLREQKLKATPQRLAILRCLAEDAGYRSPEEIWQRLKGEFGRIGLPTVYRNLEELAERGMICKVHHPNRQLYYFSCGSSGHHHHFICLACRRVEEVPGCSLASLEREIRSRSGATVLSHIVQLNGLCRACAPVLPEEGGADAPAFG
jgi:Fur family zinc uptake transcriptional regulator/Fur family ferric uptake transcriptional regulator